MLGERAAQGAVFAPPPFTPRSDRCNFSCSILSQRILTNKNKNKNIFISINNDLANLYIEENYTNVNIAIMVISIRVMIIKYNIQN